MCRYEYIQNKVKDIVRVEYFSVDIDDESRKIVGLYLDGRFTAEQLAMIAKVLVPHIGEDAYASV